MTVEKLKFLKVLLTRQVFKCNNDIDLERLYRLRGYLNKKIKEG